MSKICNNCGKENRDNMTFCAQCGTKLPEAEANKVDEFEVEPTMRAIPVQHKPSDPAPVPVKPAEEKKTAKVKAADEHAPGAFKFLVYRIIFAMPLIGWIMAFVCSFIAGDKAIKSYARATLIWTLIWLAVFVVLFILVNNVVNGVITDANAQVSGMSDKLGIFFDIISQKLTNTNITIG